MGVNPIIRAAALGSLCLSAVSFGAAGKPANFDGFARCLSEKKAVMYGAFYCEHCK